MYQVYTWEPLSTVEMQEQLDKMYHEDDIELIAVWGNFFIFKKQDDGEADETE